MKRLPLPVVLLLAVTLTLYFFQALLTVRLPRSEAHAELYANQLRDDLQKALVTAIEKAERSIIVLSYSFSDAKVIQALRRKAESGVEVLVIVDAKASPKAKQQLGPQVKTLRRSPLGLMHLKLLIVDEKQIWIGSANLTYDSLRLHGNLIVAMENPVFAAQVAAKMRDLPPTGPVTHSGPLRFLLADQSGELWLLPNHSSIRRLLGLIQEAKKSIRVAMFTWTRPDLTKALIQAAERGVQVEAVIDRRQGQGAGAETVRRLVQAGIPVSLSQGDGLLHHKMLWIDEAILVNGSANWTRSAFQNNDDCFLVLEPLTEGQIAQLKELWRVLLFESERFHHLFNGKEAHAMLDPDCRLKCA